MVRDHKYNFVFNWVMVNKLGIGVLPRTEDNLLILQKNKIKTILSLCEEHETLKLYDNFFLKKNILPDHSYGLLPTKKQIIETIEIIEDSLKAGPVFVHCKAGVERSPTVCLAWLILKELIPFEHALLYLKDVHPNTNPHFDQLEIIKSIIE